MREAHRKLLGVSPDDDPQEIKAAFRRYALRHHPDVGGDPARFQAGVEAWRALDRFPPDAQSQNVVFYRRMRRLGFLSVCWHRLVWALRRHDRSHKGF